MSYSKSETVIKRVKPLLDLMVRAESDIAWPTDNAHMLGYRLREAMLLAKKRGIEPYNTLRDKFIIRDKGTRVVAELRSVEMLSALQNTMARMTLENVSSLMEIIGAAISYKTNDIYFPNAELNQEEITKLYTWCQSNAYFLVIGTGVTLTKTDPGDAKWLPEST